MLRKLANIGGTCNGNTEITHGIIAMRIVTRRTRNLKKNEIVPRVADSLPEEIMYAGLIRKCRRCKVQKALNEYSTHKLRKNGTWSLRANCKPCNVIAVSEWYQKHKEHTRRQMRERYRKHAHVRERIRNEGFKKAYGITVDQYDEMLKAQNYQCAICKEPQSNFKRRFDIDHCHKTKKIRGICCIRCNRGIGLLQDDPKLLRFAANYIEKNKK